MMIFRLALLALLGAILPAAAPSLIPQTSTASTPESKPDTRAAADQACAQALQLFAQRTETSMRLAIVKGQGALALCKPHPCLHRADLQRRCMCRLSRRRRRLALHQVETQQQQHDNRQRQQQGEHQAEQVHGRGPAQGRAMKVVAMSGDHTSPAQERFEPSPEGRGGCASPSGPTSRSLPGNARRKPRDEPSTTANAWPRTRTANAGP